MFHFTKEEFLSRQQETCRRMIADGLDGLILFRQESMYYLTGYDTSGYSMFQAGFINADGKTALLTRSADQIQSSLTSIFEEIRIWRDGEDADPGKALREMLVDLGCKGKKLGVEYHAYGLTGQRSKMVDKALEPFVSLVDASDLVRVQRLVKSDAELEYIRHAGTLCDAIFKVSCDLAVPGVWVKSIYGAMMKTILDGGGDPSASRWPMGAGEYALFGRYHTGDEMIKDQDQIVFEPAASYRHYHACSMYNIVTGKPHQKQIEMNLACAEALDSCQDALRPGRSVGEIFNLHESIFKTFGYEKASLAACGYTVGATYPPTWMDWPMFWAGNEQEIEKGMVFFLHMILFDNESGLSMCMGETSIVLDNGPPEKVNHVPRELIVN